MGKRLRMEESVLDADVFDALQDSMGEDFVVELVTTFLDEAPRRIDDLKTAAAQSDVDGFRRAAHSLKSNANVFGANQLAELARHMELGGLEAGDAAQIETLEDGFANAAAELIEWRDG